MTQEEINKSICLVFGHKWGVKNKKTTDDTTTSGPVISNLGFYIETPACQRCKISRNTQVSSDEECVGDRYRRRGACNTK